MLKMMMSRHKIGTLVCEVNNQKRAMLAKTFKATQQCLNLCTILPTSRHLLAITLSVIILQLGLYVKMTNTVVTGLIEAQQSMGDQKHVG